MIDVKPDSSVDKLGKKYLDFILPIEEALENYYDRNVHSKPLEELFKIFWYSRSKIQIIERLAGISFEENDLTARDKLFCSIEDHLGASVLDDVLKEFNSDVNGSLDPEKNYAFMPASQAYDVQNGKAYVYFNSISSDDSGVKVVPALLANDKRVIRLDQFRRKSNQHLLIVDGSFQLHEEITTAIMNTETSSLKSKHVKKFIDGEIAALDVTPRMILEKMVALIKKVFYTEDETLYVILALFAYSTYFYQLFGVTPYLFLNAQKGSGKSLLASVLSKICFCCRYTVGTTEAALFRTISNCGGTIILDEMENLTSREKTADSLMASILKSGYSKNTGNTLRTNLETKSIEEFSLFGPKIISNIYGLEDVVEDRCIRIPLKKYDASVTNKMMNFQVFENNYSDQLEEISSLACISALVNYTEIYGKFVSIDLDMGSARNSQIMRPILTLASLAGQEYEDAVNQYYQTYMQKDKEWMDLNSPEGALKQAFKILEEEAGGSYSEWIDEHSLKHFVTRIGNEITANTFVIKLLMDEIDGKKNYSMSEVHKLIKRVNPNLDFGRRTSIGIASNDNWVRLMGNRDKVSVYQISLHGSEPCNSLSPEIF
ncbi:MAG TPA: hypothetical protein VM577_12400 [Anaerovoracaceae bacterium]|nr:hypothetical protein [Anaerovoracaceae bacterium]